MDDRNTWSKQLTEYNRPEYEDVNACVVQLWNA